MTEPQENHIMYRLRKLYGESVLSAPQLRQEPIVYSFTLVQWGQIISFVAIADIYHILSDMVVRSNYLCHRAKMRVLFSLLRTWNDMPKNDQPIE